MKDFTNKTVVITGAGSGIGRALAEEFAKLGANLALNDIETDALNETIKLLPSNTKIFTQTFDVSNADAMFNFAKECKNHFGEIDIVINNAGVSSGKLSVEAIDLALFKWVMDINFWGVVYGSKAFLPYLKTRSEASIVNISSIFGFMGIGFQAPYCSSKFAVRGFSESLAVELHNTSIHVMCVHPAGVKTNIANKSRGGNEADKQEFNKLLIADPNEIALKIIKGIKRKNQRLRVGKGATVVDWLNRFKPFHIANFIQQKALKYREKQLAKK